MAHATTSATGAPFAKLISLGDKLVGAFASDPGESRRQARDFTTQAPATKTDGKPLYEEVMHFVAMPGTTAKVGNAPNYLDITPGQHVRYSVKGYKWGQVIDARKELPAYNGFPAGSALSGDIYEITLIGWSASTDNPAGAQAAGYTVENGRIVMRTQEQKNNYVLMRSNANLPATVGIDLGITIRRPSPAEADWERQADDLFLTKPWKIGAAEHADVDPDVAAPAPASVTGPSTTPF